MIPLHDNNYQLFNNPFYFLSAILMLIGCIPIQMLAANTPHQEFLKYNLVFECMAYETVLFLGFIVLMKIMRQFRDAQILLCLGFFFAFDPTCAYISRCFTDYTQSIFIILISSVCAVLKLIYAFRLLHIHADRCFYRDCSIAFALTMGCAYGLPLLHLDSSQAQLWALYIFCQLSIAPFLFIQFAQHVKGFCNHKERIQLPCVYRYRALIHWLPKICIASHLYVYAYMTDQPFLLCFVSVPFCMWAWKYVSRSKDKAFTQEIILMHFFAMVIVTISNSDKLWLADGLISPFRLMIVYLIIMDLILLFRKARYSIVVVLSLCCALLFMGPDWNGIFQSAASISDNMPNDGFTWASIALVGAFVCIGVGLLLSNYHSQH
ncbi:MAG: hypothetical protein HRU15_00295 [Planctomycetes bacterium]|nr:hypothetical protein [Planctomycetota bacterium]